MTGASARDAKHSLVAIAAEAGLIDADLLRPADGLPRPAVLLLTDIRGVRPAFEAMAARIAARGYVVLLPNLYYRGGPAPVVDPTLPVTDENARVRRGELRAALTPEAIRADLRALLDYLHGHPDVRGAGIGVVGYCMSGSFALRAAAAFPQRVAAAAIFHGGGLASDAPDSPHRDLAGIKARLYFGHADQDASMPAEMISRLDAALDAAGIDFRAELYEGARHGFAVADSPAFDHDAAERHWRNLIALFDTTLYHAAT